MCTSPELSPFLALIPTVLSQNEAFVAELEDCVRSISIRKGELLIRAGSICQNAYLIKKGLFMNQYVNENGHECVTGFSSEEQYPFLSTTGYFTQEPTGFEVKALDRGELLSFSRTDIDRLSHNYPPFATFYQNVMLMLISKLYNMFAVRQTSSSEEFLRYLYAHQQWIVNRVPDKYIAQYMGISDSWYCKLKKRLLEV